MPTILEDFEWFDKNREKIIEGHLNESVVIKDKKVLSYYPDDSSALNAMRGQEKGSFIIQRCIPVADDVQYYYTGRYSF